MRKCLKPERAICGNFAVILLEIFLFTSGSAVPTDGLAAKTAVTQKTPARLLVQ